MSVGDGYQRSDCFAFQLSMHYWAAKHTSDNEGTSTYAGHLRVTSLSAGTDRQTDQSFETSVILSQERRVYDYLFKKEVWGARKTNS